MMCLAMSNFGMRCPVFCSLCSSTETLRAFVLFIYHLTIRLLQTLEYVLCLVNSTVSFWVLLNEEVLVRKPSNRLRRNYQRFGPQGSHFFWEF